MPILYLVATPIGNLEDITARALRILREVRLIAAEDTRHTRQLLNHFGVETRCISYHEHNKLARQEAILAALTEGDVALVSDAGTPAISDPGYELVRACIDAGFTITPIPGPSAPIAALVASGLPTERFIFVGFLPRRSPERRALLHDLAELTVSIVCFEAPHRLTDMLTDALTVWGERQVAVAKDLTKLFEAIWRGSLSEALAHFSVEKPRGEYTVVFAGKPTLLDSKQARKRVQAHAGDGEEPSEAEILRRLRSLREQGKSGSAAARTVARELNLNKSLVYHIWLSLGEEDDEEG
jgi:16S rRNA (cytidine1402-2'-O)-methyltransferase